MSLTVDQVEKMDAIEVYKSVKEDLHSTEDDVINNAIFLLFMNLSSTARSCTNPDDFVNRVKHACNIWNNIRDLDLREYHETNMSEDGFKVFWIDQVPELKYFL